MIYWIEDFGFEFFNSRLRRVDVTASPRVVETPIASMNQVADLKAVSENRVIMREWSGNLVSAALVDLPPVPFWLTVTIATNVTEMTCANDTLYWAEQISPTRVDLKSAPLNDSSGVTTIESINREDPHEVREMAANANDLFYQNLTATSSGPLMRKSLTSSDPPVEIAALGYRSSEMAMGERHVFWRRTSKVISRLPIGAAAISRDLAATGMEVVQVLQNPNNENPLVMGKTTHVRVFGQILTSSAGETSLNAWPGAYLHGTKDGVPLEGSPLSPYNPAPPVRNTAPDRTMIDQGFLFRIPDAWTRRGVIDLVGEINPGGAFSETDMSNNSRTVSADFVKKAPICMVMKPTLTQNGMIRRYHPSFEQMFNYIEALLPTSEIRVVWSGGVIEEPWDPAHVMGDGGPFEVSDDDNDGWSLLVELFHRKSFTTRRYCNSLGGFDHYCAILPSFPDRAWNGLASVGDDLGRTMPQSAFFARLAQNSLGVPLAAGTQCQELGHNYGRFHIDCGSPPNIDSAYPYDGCSLSNSTADYLGFNPFTRRLVDPTVGRDFMTYAGPRWTSDFTWKGIMNRMGNLMSSPGGSLRAPVALTTSLTSNKMFIAGFFDDHDGFAAIKQALPTGSAEQIAIDKSIVEMGGSSFLELEAYDASENLLGVFPVAVNQMPADEGAQSGYLFFALAEIPSATVRLDLRDTEFGHGVVRSLEGGINPPTISILDPLPGTVVPCDGDLRIEWNASDPDGDALVYMVRYSPDCGATWYVLGDGNSETELTVSAQGLPGADPNECMIEVTVSDGILSASAQSEKFTLQLCPPEVYINLENRNGKIFTPIGQAFYQCGEPVVAYGKAFDDEDGQIAPEHLHWSVTGPVNCFVSGKEIRLTELPPGDYMIKLETFDSSQMEGSASTQITVEPCYIETGAAIHLDGYGDDAGYFADAYPKEIHYQLGGNAAVRMVHHAGKIYVCAQGLRVGTEPDSRFAVSVDVNGAAGPSLESDDLRFEVSRSGTVRTYIGDGSKWIEDMEPQGLEGRVSENAGRWTAELCIDAARVGGYGPGSPVIGLAIGHYQINQTGETASHVFKGTQEWVPSTWAETCLQAQPKPTVDSDDDDLEDWWEIQFYGNLQLAGGNDQDGDGDDDRTEFLLGNSPLDPDSSFSPKAQATENGTFLEWQGSPGRNYTIHRSFDMKNWEAIAHAVTDNFWIDPDVIDARAFYQVEAHYIR